MKRLYIVAVVMLCLVSFAAADTNPCVRANDNNTKITMPVGDNSPAPYRPSLRAGVLFVEDPGSAGLGPVTKPDPTWVAVLDSTLGVGNYGWFGPTLDGATDGPDLTTMQGYDLVIWNCYDYWWSSPAAALTSNDISNLSSYMDGGGKVWLSGCDIVWSGVSIPGFLTPYFHVESVVEDYGSPLAINLHGLAEVLCHSFLSTVDYPSNPFYADALTPDAAAHAFLEDTDNTQNVGIFYPGIDYMAAFQTVDGRSPDVWDEWEAIVGGMLDAFGVLGVAETPVTKPVATLQVNASPVPFNRSTTISYIIPGAANVTLQVYDKLGSRVTTLVDGYKTAGTYYITWNGKDINGVNVPNGIYFLRLICGAETYTGNLVVVR